MLALVTFSLSMVCYLVFAGQVSTSEIIAAVPASGLIAAFAFLRHRGQDRPIQLWAPWSRLLLSLLAALLRDTGRVGGHLLRLAFVPRLHSDGSIDSQPFHPGHADPAGAGRRALVTLAASFAPNGFVLDVAPSVLLGDEPALLMHHLLPSAPHSDVEWPV